MTMVELANEEMVPRMEKAVVTLTELATNAHTEENRQRLILKAEGVQAILDAERERLQHMRDTRDVVTMTALIEAKAKPEHIQAVKLVQGYLLEYAH